ncbi:ATP synthase subunit b, mitochondrial [Biomphalaria glabrata]|nr:ATP synthase subunit b, mitochondrial [Biomphalaria glabrata]
MRPSPTSPYGLIIQAPLMSHFIASYTRAGVFCCLKADLSSSPHIPVEGESLITLDPNRRHSRLTSQDRSATTTGFEEFKYFTRPINRWKDAANAEIAKNERLIEETETSKHMYLAKKEGIQLQLEAAYRQRLQNAFQEVKKRLDFEVEKVSLKRKYEQEHMVNWIVSSVTKSITPQQEKESIKSCIDSLKRLSAKAAAV